MTENKVPSTIGPNEMFCSSCGSVIPKESAFCTVCGTKFDRPRKRKENTAVSDFFGFKKMISHTFIKVIYIIGMAVTTILSLVIIILGSINNSGNYYFGFGGITVFVVIGLCMLIFGNLFWRIICEVMVLFSNIHDMISKMEKSKN